MVVQRLVTHEQAEVAPGGDLAADVRSGVEAASASANTWSGGVMWSERPREQVQRHVESAQVDGSVADGQGPEMSWLSRNRCRTTQR